MIKGEGQSSGGKKGCAYTGEGQIIYTTYIEKKGKVCE
jgi:hypothetical protein